MISASLEDFDENLEEEVAEMQSLHGRESGRVAASLFTTLLDPSAKVRYRHGIQMASIEYERCHDAVTLALRSGTPGCPR